VLASVGLLPKRAPWEALYVVGYSGLGLCNAARNQRWRCARRGSARL